MSKVVDFERKRSKKESTNIDLPEFFNEVLATFEEPERSYMQLWFEAWCNCDKETFNKIYNYIHEVILYCSKVEKSTIKLLFYTIQQYRAERGLYYVKGSRF